MADGFVIVEAEIPTATTGSVDLVATGGKAWGALPTGCLLISTSASAVGSSAGAQRAISISDGTRWCCMGGRSRDGVSASSGSNGAWLTHDGLGSTVDQFIRLISLSSTTFLVDADFDSFITNGVRITVNTNNLGAAAKVVCLFFYGDTQCGVDAIEITTGLEETHSGFGITGTANMAVLLEDVNFGASSTSQLVQSIGVCVNDGSLTQAATSIESDYSGATLATALSTGTYALNKAGTTSPNFDRVEVTGFGTDSITVIQRNYTGGSVPRFGVLLVQFAALEARCGITLTDTDALPHTQSVAAGLNVSGGLVVGTRDTALDTHIDATSPWGSGVGLFDATTQHAVAISNEDAASPTQTTTYYDDQIAYAVPINTGAFTAGSSHQASITPTASGFDLAYSITDTSTARYFLWLVWGAVDQEASVQETVEVSESVKLQLGLQIHVQETVEVAEGPIIILSFPQQTIEQEEDLGALSPGGVARGEISQSQPQGEISS